METLVLPLTTRFLVRAMQIRIQMQWSMAAPIGRLSVLPIFSRLARVGVLVWLVYMCCGWLS